jgi:hypothetical protein
MSRLTSIRAEFVEFVPKELEEGVLYISIPYSTTVHRCACGCGGKVTLPINPVKWRFLYDGERISVWPSVGNWSFECQSHYWIEQNQIEWAPKWSRYKIEEARARDRADREHYLKSVTGPARPHSRLKQAASGLIDRITGLLRR